jgi:3-hydroxyisobutyrate dehydrogenase/2-hydroxy-3-oxopropionate reductase
MRIEFFGLGEMGYAMAGHLARAGHAVFARERDARRLAQWRDEFGIATENDAPEAVITSVTDQAALRRMMDRPDGLALSLKAGVLWIDHTTSSPEFARECAGLAAKNGAAYVDVAMSGGAAGARAGALALFAGGAPADAARAREITAPYSKYFAHFGGAGAGQAAKLAHQLAIAGTVLGLRAALDYGQSHDMPPGLLLAALAQGTAHSVQLDQHAAKMGIPGFEPVDGFAWLARDLAALAETSPALPLQLRELISTASKPVPTGAQ